MFVSCLMVIISFLLLTLVFVCPSFSKSFQSVQSLSRVQLFATPWTEAHQASLSITNSWSLPKLLSIESLMPSNHLILSSPPPPAFNLSQHQESQNDFEKGQSWKTYIFNFKTRKVIKLLRYWHLKTDRQIYDAKCTWSTEFWQRCWSNLMGNTSFFNE